MAQKVDNFTCEQFNNRFKAIFQSFKQCAALELQAEKLKKK